MEFNLAVLWCVYTEIWDHRIWLIYMSWRSQFFVVFPVCIFHHSNIRKNNTLGATSEVMSQNIKASKSLKTGDLSKKKDQLNFRRKNGAIGQVTIGSKQDPICVPSSSAITVLGQTSKIAPRISCLVQQAQHHNLPPGIVINSCVATTKARSVPVILINTNRQNVWIQQPLLAAELFSTDQVEGIEHRANGWILPPPVKNHLLALDLMWNLEILISRQKLITCLLSLTWGLLLKWHVNSRASL